MNKKLYDDFKKLNETEASELSFKFKDSPVGLKLIHFLQACTNRNFKNSDAVASVYGSSKDKSEYGVLENRYFKLRKKIHDELLKSTSDNQSGELLTPEQLILFRNKNITSATNKEGAYKELLELEKECWRKNIFELLPDILDQLIFLNQSFNRLERNKPLFERLEKAAVLQNDMNRCIVLSRKIYEINFVKGIKAAKAELALIKDFAEKHKAYPRFLMCYHHISLYYKLGSQDYLHYQQVVSRHLTAFKKLFAKHSETPLLSYKVNYTKFQHFHFNNITMFFHFNRCEFEEAYHFMNDSWALVNNNDSVLKVYKTETLYFNLTTAQCMTGRFAEANATNNLFITFLKENNQLENLPFAYVQKARIISDTFPQTFKMDIDFLMNQVEEYIKKVRKTENALASLEDTLVLKLKWLILKKQFAKAANLLEDKIVVNVLTQAHVLDLFQEFILLLQQPSDKNRLLEELVKKAQQRKHKATTPGEFMHLNWIQNHVRYLLR
ncbi:MAG: hypothetical protein IPP64_09005 [Bacteroidetes bacterium]|nr:hypothetical protein [Bacteroidota bacterium]